MKRKYRFTLKIDLGSNPIRQLMGFMLYVNYRLRHGYNFFMKTTCDHKYSLKYFIGKGEPGGLCGFDIKDIKYHEEKISVHPEN